MKKALLPLALVLVAGSARADLITFESDLGNKPNGWSSLDSANVTFSDTDGANLDVDNYGSQSISRGLAVFGDDSSAIRMLFVQPYLNLSLVFGNDDAGVAQINDWASLKLYNNTVFVGSALVQLNANDLADQTISWSGGAFDEAIFQYVDQDFEPLNLIEIIDNVEFGGQPVPEPSTVIGGLALGALALRRALRRK